MTGAVIAAISVSSVPLPTWANISGAHAGASNSAKDISASPATIVVTWTPPSPTIAMSVTWDHGTGSFTSGSPVSLTTGATGVFFTAAASGATGPVTLTVSCAGFTPTTFTVTLT